MPSGSSKVPHADRRTAKQRAADNDDPFMQGATTGGFDASDPFDLDNDNQDQRRNLLPHDILHLPLQFCDAKTLLTACCVNRTWHEVAELDACWKELVKITLGSDTVRSNKRYCKQMGYKLIYFVGVCKTILVNTPDKQCMALGCYPGLTINDLMFCLGIERPRHYRIGSSNFSDVVATEIEENEDDHEGCWPELLQVHLSRALVEPMSSISIVSARRKSNKRHVLQHDEDEDDGDVKLNRQVEQQIKLSWNTRALAQLRTQPGFILEKMKIHWTNLIAAAPKTKSKTSSSTGSSSGVPPSQSSKDRYTQSAVHASQFAGTQATPRTSTPGGYVGAQPTSGSGSRHQVPVGTAAPHPTPRVPAASAGSGSKFTSTHVGSNKSRSGHSGK